MIHTTQSSKRQLVVPYVPALLPPHPAESRGGRTPPPRQATALQEFATLRLQQFTDSSASRRTGRRGLTPALSRARAGGPAGEVEQEAGGAASPRGPRR